MFFAIAYAQANAKETQRFSDVSADSRFFLPVEYLKDKNLIQGYKDGTFHPEKVVTRAEALAMILKASEVEVNADTEQKRELDAENPIEIQLPAETNIVLQNMATGEKTTLEGIKDLRIDVISGSSTLKILKKSSEKPFDDVTSKDWFYDTVREAKRLGLIKGYGKGNYFKPNNTINLAEALRILLKTNSVDSHLSEEAVPVGIDKNVWFAKDFAYAVGRALITQQENGTVFPPEKDLNRGEIALLLYRFLRTKDNVTFGYASWYGDGLSKARIDNGLEYKAKNLTAAHKTIPFGTIVKVTNVVNGKEVKVVINDRGPFVTGRIVDLSKSAFAALESPTVGLISVQLEVVE